MAERDAFAPKRIREIPRIEQVKLAFPVAAKVEYRWRFADETTTGWRPAPANDMLRAPPGATGCDWREPLDNAAKPLNLPTFLARRDADKAV